jgi:hypothetical protein
MKKLKRIYKGKTGKQLVIMYRRLGLGSPVGRRSMTPQRIRIMRIISN